MPDLSGLSAQELQKIVDAARALADELGSNPAAQTEIRHLAQEASQAIRALAAASSAAAAEAAQASLAGILKSLLAGLVADLGLLAVLEAIGLALGWTAAQVLNELSLLLTGSPLLPPDIQPTGQFFDASKTPTATDHGK